MVKTFDPSTPQEYIVKAVSCASLGQEMENAELLKQAQQYFQVVGASASECDTIPGRQCMASFHFLLKQFDDALIYLKVQTPSSYKLEIEMAIDPLLALTCVVLH